jgi:hypothetical protein
MREEVTIMREQFTAWITKYALTEGIIEQHVEHCSDISDGMVSILGKRCFCYHGEGKDWHRTRDGAVKRAEKMRLAKIALLRAQIEKLEGLRFCK